MIKIKKKFKNVLKRIIFSYFLTTFLERIIFQPFYKTIRLFGNISRFRNTLWTDWHSEFFETWALNKNKNLYNESLNFYLKFNENRKKILSGLPISGGNIKTNVGGGGGNEILLYFLTRMIKAKKVLETGVSAGSSSRTILEALKDNGGGKLYSSDLATALEQSQVGILVGDSLRGNWSLFENGDLENIHKIYEEESNFDIIYYDSDKSYLSKKWFHKEILKNQLPKILVYDDIDRDSFFPECVKTYGYKFKVFGSAGVIFFSENYS